jgi:uncharacterized protein (DUF1684 family)
MMITRFSVVVLLLCLFACNGKSDYVNSVEQEHVRRQAVFMNPEQSPLDTAELRIFKGLQFFPVNETFRTEALITWLPQVHYLNMPQTGGDVVPYMQTAVIDFAIEGKQFQLPAYQTEEMKRRHLLFIPYTDLTNGKETYNGGRYIDLPYVDTRREVMLDFNLGYIPYCAHTPRYSCPVVPRENNLNIAVMAGERLAGTHP